MRSYMFMAMLAVVGVVGTVPANGQDCNLNGIDDACDLDCGDPGGACDLSGCGASQDCDANGVPDECDLAVGAGGCPFPLTLFENTTTGEDSRFLAPPDDLSWGLGGQTVTFEFDCGVVVDGPGPDITVYELDGGAQEFSSIDVLVSDDGVSFVSIKSTETSAVNIPGDDAHGSNAYARSYDVAGSGLQAVTLVRLDGNGTGASGSGTGFDLDAIGAVNRVGLDCDSNGTLDVCEPVSDCDADGLPDCWTITAGLIPDCNTNDVPDACDVASATSADCNTNLLPDECETECNGNGIPDDCDIGTGTSDDCDANGNPDECDIAANVGGCPFPRTLSENTTTGEDYRFLGPPDDIWWGLGGQIVTYEFDCGFLIDGPGPDLTVYEVDGGGAEFSSIDVLVSTDGASFVSVKVTETAAVNVPGDEAHGSNTFARSYDLGDSGLSVVRFIRIDGAGTGASGSGTGFDLDAIGMVNRLGVDCDSSGVLDVCEGLGDCNSDGLPDSCFIAEGLATDCNFNDVPDECENDSDCDGNDVPDMCDLAIDGCPFPQTLSENTTGSVDGTFVGAPDGAAAGLGGDVVTYEFDCGFIVDAAGPDLTVYEASSGLIEFDTMDVLVSDDGVSFVSIRNSESAAVNIPGDEAHGNNDYARSYDLAGSGFRSARFVKLDGDGGAGNLFDLDAIGAINHVGRDCDSNGTLDICESTPDCDDNLLPDSCEIAFDPDCNFNETLDECDITSGSSNDVDSDVVPDECEPDCNANLIPDDFDIAEGTSTDCNHNIVPDECDLASGVSEDCNVDAVPDECPICPTVEVAYIMDVSTSMTDEGGALCSSIAQITADLEADLIVVDNELMGITGPGSGQFSCLTEGVTTNYGTAVPGSPPPGNETLGDCPGGDESPVEDWGRATSVVAGTKPWLSDSVRLIVPLSDEGPWCGDPVTDPGVDRDSVLHAIGIAQANDTTVSPVTASGSSAAVITLAQTLADATGGLRVDSTDLAQGVVTVILEACDSRSDCNDNDVPDSCDIAAGTSQDCDLSGVPDECEEDCNRNGLHDSCDIATGTSEDLNLNDVPDDCEIIELLATATELLWTEAEGAIGYDVVWGPLGVLHSSLGDFTLATTGCLVNDVPSLTTPHTVNPDPASGEGEWYLVRAVQGLLNLGYETFSPSQIGTRDPEIAASPTPCP